MEGKNVTWERTPSAAVIKAVADAEKVDPADLSEPLFTVVSPDALDTLFHTETGKVIFEYHGYEVTVHATGEVEAGPLHSE